MEYITDVTEKKTQRVLLSTWLVELLIDNLNKLEASAEGELPETATPLQKQQQQEAADQFEKANESFKQFLKKYSGDLDTELIIQLLQSHGRLSDCLFFATEKRNYEAIVLHHINNRDFEKALFVLSGIREEAIKYPLMIRYASVFMKHQAKYTIDILLQSFKTINIEELLPSLLTIQTSERFFAVNYIKQIMETSKNKLLHNLYIFFLAQSSEIAGQDELINYLDQQEILQKNNQPIYFDKDFALNVCKYFERHEGQIRVYGMLGLYEEAVKLAIKDKNFAQAKKYANMPADEKLKKKLWLQIAKEAMQEYSADKKSGLEIINESQSLTLGDVISFVSAKVKLSTFRDDLLSSLKNFGDKIDHLKTEMTDFNKSSQNIMDGLQAGPNTPIAIPGNQYCEKCKGPLLGCDKVYLFPCMHSFHKECLIEWIYAFKQYIPSGKHEKLERIEILSRKIKALQKKRDEVIAKEEGGEENTGFFNAIGGMFSGKRAKKLEEENISGLNPEEADSLRIFEKQLENLLSDECLICGALFIETLDMPFDSPDEIYWMLT